MSTADFRYRAFISYSHKDTAAARWLHKSLEGFALDKPLVGEPSPVGLLPSEHQEWLGLKKYGWRDARAGADCRTGREVMLAPQIKRHLLEIRRYE